METYGKNKARRFFGHFIRQFRLRVIGRKGTTTFVRETEYEAEFTVIRFGRHVLKNLSRETEEISEPLH